MLQHGNRKPRRKRRQLVIVIPDPIGNLIHFNPLHIMKKSAIILAAAIVLAACNKTETSVPTSDTNTLYFFSNYIDMYGSYRANGFSVRCVQD